MTSVSIRFSNRQSERNSPYVHHTNDKVVPELTSLLETSTCRSKQRSSIVISASALTAKNNDTEHSECNFLLHLVIFKVVMRSLSISQHQLLKIITAAKDPDVSHVQLVRSLTITQNSFRRIPKDQRNCAAKKNDFQRLHFRPHNRIFQVVHH